MKRLHGAHLAGAVPAVGETGWISWKRRVDMKPFSASEPLGVVDIERRFVSHFDVTADGRCRVVAQVEVRRPYGSWHHGCHVC